MSAQRSMTAKEWLFLIVLASIWSTSFYFFKVLLVQLPVLTIVLGRVGIGAVALCAIVYLSGNRLPSSPRVWGSYIIMGLLANIVPFSLIAFGETRISSGMASILNATTPLFTVLIAHYATRDELFSVNKLIGLVFGFAGVLVLIAPSSPAGFNLGAVAVIGSSLCYAFAGLYGKRFRETPPLVSAAAQVTASAVVLAPVCLWLDKPWLLPALTLSTWACLFGIALLCTAVAYFLYFRVLSTAGATNLSLVTFLVPIGAVALGAVVLHEAMTIRTIIGALIIFVGIAAIDGRLFTAVRTMTQTKRAACADQIS